MPRTAAIAAAVLILATACSPSASPAVQPSNACATPTTSAAGCGSPATRGPSPSADPTPTPESPTEAPSSQAAGDLVFTSQTYPVTRGAHPHDVAIASDGGIWYTGQRNETLGWLDPTTGDVREAKLPNGAAPHGVITGPDGAAWVTDQGADAIIRVTPGDFDVDVFRMPAGARGMAPHTGVFDSAGTLWFTGAGGVVARLDPATGEIQAFDTPRGDGPYGITVTPADDIYFVSLEDSYLGRVDTATGDVEVIEPPTAGAGTRRVWSDSTGRLWVSYWNAGMLAVYDPETDDWREWDLPGRNNMGYSLYVDELDAVWISDFGQNAIVRFDLVTETFLSFPSNRANASVRQMLGRPGEAWGAESGLDRLVVIRY